MISISQGSVCKKTLRRQGKARILDLKSKKINTKSATPQEPWTQQIEVNGKLICFQIKIEHEKAF